MVTSSPEFAEPKTTRPYLTAENPFSWAVFTIPSVGAGPVFSPSMVTFDVVSEDLNQPLQAVLVLDYQGPSSTERPFPGKTIEPGHLDAANVAVLRQVGMPFLLPTGTPPGCHTLTAVVSHDLIPGTATPRTEADIGTLTWWLNVQDLFGQGSTPQNLATCFAGNIGVSDAGAAGASQ